MLENILLFLALWLSWWRPWATPSSFLARSLSLHHSDQLLAKMSHFTLFAVFLAAEQKVEPVSFRQRSGPRHHCFDTWNTIWTIWTNSCNVFFCNTGPLQHWLSWHCRPICFLLLKILALYVPALILHTHSGATRITNYLAEGHTWNSLDSMDGWVLSNDKYADRTWSDNVKYRFLDEVID